MLRALPEEFTVKESSKDGLGLFASKDIVIFPTAITHIHHPFLGWLRTAVGAFLNHSDTPNCVIQENTTSINTQTSINSFNLDRYLLGSRYNASVNILIKVKYLIHNYPIKKDDEITIEYEDVLYHGLRPIDYPRVSSTQEEGQTKKNLELAGHAI
tara:strand:- start:2394 stop:2861 length:468 start_codon:yes stop_codon:yes gene_type:complete